MCIHTRDCAPPPAGSESPRARRLPSDSNANLPARSRRDVAPTLERAERAVVDLLPKASKSGNPQPRPLHVSPLAHLGFENPVEESYITHPDLLYRLIRRDAMPIARVSLPSPHIPRFRFQSACNFMTCPITTPRTAADQPKVPATSFLLNTPSASTTWWGATVSVKCAPSADPRIRPRRCPLTALPILYLLLPLRCAV